MAFVFLFTPDVDKPGFADLSGAVVFMFSGRYSVIVLVPGRFSGCSPRSFSFFVDKIFGFRLVVFSIVVVVALFAPILAPHNPAAQNRDALLLPPVFMEGGRWAYALGTDAVGRDILSRLTRMAEGRIEVVLRGRPALREFDDFHGRVAKEPFIRFEGPYRNPDDLSAIYGEVHFAWAIDYFEAGLNSDWLLPNRLYESCLHGVVPIALSATETGRTLARRDIGIRVDAATPEALLAALPLNEEGYAAERARVTARPRSFWVCGPSECTALVARLAALPGEAPPKGRAMMEAAG